MNILFIGGAGFIGSNLVKTFVEDEVCSVLSLNQNVPMFQDLMALMLL